jgi:methionyl-tRNA formyltransferase
MKLVFSGTPEFAVPSLEAVLADGHEVALVLTQPDRPVGRKQEMQAPALKQFALARGLEVLQPEKIKTNEDLRARLESIQPDAIVVVAYGRIIPPWMLALPRFGCLNVHASLLPKYRGAAPIQWAVANGETETGVSIMRLDEGLDTGGVYVKVPVRIGPDTLAIELFVELAHVGARALVGVLGALAGGAVEAFPQEESEATLAPILKREDGRIDAAGRTAKTIYDRWRGFTPWPGAHGVLRGKRFLLQQMWPGVEAVGAGPGSLILQDGELHLVAADGRSIVLAEVQIEGKARMPGAQFARDFQLQDGEQLE